MAHPTRSAALGSQCPKTEEPDASLNTEPLESRLRQGHAAPVVLPSPHPGLDLGDCRGVRQGPIRCTKMYWNICIPGYVYHVLAGYVFQVFNIFKMYVGAGERMRQFMKRPVGCV